MLRIKKENEKSFKVNTLVVQIPQNIIVKLQRLHTT